MAIHNFSDKQQFVSTPQPDHRSDEDRENSLISIYDHDNPDIAYAEREAENLINDSGAWMKLYVRVNDLTKVDDTYDEEADPQYGPPIRLKGQYVPDPIATSLNKWGSDTVVEIKINFSRARLWHLTNGRLIREGDILEIPHNTLVQTQRTEFSDGPDFALNKFEVVSVKDVGNFNYRWLYWQCAVKNVTGDKTVRPQT